MRVASCGALVYTESAERIRKEGEGVIWVCTRCGYEVESDKRPDLCAMCYAAMHHMVPKKEKTEQKQDEKGEDGDARGAPGKGAPRVLFMAFGVCRRRRRG